MNKILQDLMKAKGLDKPSPPKAPKKGRCTGCDCKFTEDYECDQECPDCGYMTCESCSCDHSQGAFKDSSLQHVAS